MCVRPNIGRENLIQGLPPVLGVDDALATLYMWLGTRKRATHGTAEADLFPFSNSPTRLLMVAHDV